MAPRKRGPRMTALSERAAQAGMCGAVSKQYRPTADAYFICTNDPGHWDPRHTACDGKGHVLARWISEASSIEVWVPGAGKVII